MSDVCWNGNIEAGQIVSIGFQLDQGNIDEALLNQEAALLCL
ncbi:MAG: hypothetical protein AAGC81_08535 [Pseudomonadota bacterium]